MFQISDKRTGQPVDEAAPYPWILHPVLDTLLGFGGIVWLLFGVHMLLLKGILPVELSQYLIMLSATGAIIFSETHTASTIVTVYRNKETRSRFSLYTRWLAFGCLVLTVAGAFFQSLAPVLVKLYLLIVPHHFMSQSYGIAMLYCMKRRYRSSRWERAVILFFVQSAAWFSVIRQLTFKPWSGESFLLVKVPFWGPLPTWVATASELTLTVSAVALAAMILLKAFKHGKILPLAAQMTIITGACAFTLGPVALGIYWLYVSAFFHGTQYLMLATAQRIKEHGLPESVPLSRISSQLLKGPSIKFYGVSLAIAISIYLLLPRLGALAGFEQITLAAVVFTTINFFHIITDGAIWKLRDRKTRDMLVA